METKYKVFPVQYVRGYVATYCRTMECAMRERKRLIDVTGVEWRVRTIN